MKPLTDERLAEIRDLLAECVHVPILELGDPGCDLYRAARDLLADREYHQKLHDNSYGTFTVTVTPVCGYDSINVRDSMIRFRGHTGLYGRA